MAWKVQYPQASRAGSDRGIELKPRLPWPDTHLLFGDHLQHLQVTASYDPTGTHWHCSGKKNMAITSCFWVDFCHAAHWSREARRGTAAVAQLRLLEGQLGTRWLQILSIQTAFATVSKLGASTEHMRRAAVIIDQQEPEFHTLSKFGKFGVRQRLRSSSILLSRTTFLH